MIHRSFSMEVAPPPPPLRRQFNLGDYVMIKDFRFWIGYIDIPYVVLTPGFNSTKDLKPGDSVIIKSCLFKVHTYLQTILILRAVSDGSITSTTKETE